MEKCGNLAYEDCGTDECDKGADSDTSGPGAWFIMASPGKLHHMYHRYYTDMFKAFGLVSGALDDMENKFAPIPREEDDTWILLLIDLIMLGSLESAAPFFNSVLKEHDWFAGKSGSALDNAKNITMTLIG